MDKKLSKYTFLDFMYKIYKRPEQTLSKFFNRIDPYFSVKRFSKHRRLTYLNTVQLRRILMRI